MEAQLAICLRPAIPVEFAASARDMKAKIKHVSSCESLAHVGG